MSRASASSLTDSHISSTKRKLHLDQGTFEDAQTAQSSPDPPSKRIKSAAPLDANVDGATSTSKNHQSKSVASQDHDTSRGDQGDLLNAVGSASSLASTVSSVFSHAGQPGMALHSGVLAQNHTLTPLTTSDSSPPGKTLSPKSAKTSNEHMSSNEADACAAVGRSSNQASETITPIHTPPESRPQVRPAPGEEKGAKLVWDPELDEKLPPKDKKRFKPKYKVFGVETDPLPPPDPRLAIAGYEDGSYHRQNAKGKQKLRLAPYVAKMHPIDSKHDEWFTPPKQVVVTGLDPLTPEAQIRTVFSSWGEIAEFRNQTDPSSGSFLGICLIRYADSKPLRGTPMSATASAKRAESEGTGQKIGLNIVKVKRDRTGRMCRQLVELKIREQRAIQERQALLEQQKRRTQMPKVPAPKSVAPGMAGLPPPPPKTSTPIVVPDAPPNAPKGPSGRPSAPTPAIASPATPVGPRPTALATRNPAHALVENEPVLTSLRRKPYLFLAHCYVPVLGTTIPHLKKRLKMYDWRECRVDETGYYVTFEDSKRGEEECERCFKECNMCALFTYVMNMECQKYGNPNYVRSPSPERVAAEKKKKAEQDSLRKAEFQDFEQEKKRRAEELDTVKGALELFGPQLKDIIMSDIRSKIAAPALYDLLDPERHSAKRQKFNIEDPRKQNVPTSMLPFGRGDLSPAVGTPDSRTHGFSGSGRKTSRFERGGKKHQQPRDLLPKPINAFLDERRKRQPVVRRPAIQSLHRRLEAFDESDDESEDEKRTTFTRDSEDLESRPTSRASPAILDDDVQTPKSKRRKVEVTPSTEQDDEETHAIAKRLLGHLWGKEPEDMAMHELQQVIAVLPRASRIRQRSLAEVKLRKRTEEEDDVLFFGKSATPSAVDAQMDDSASVDVSVATPEPETAVKSKKKGVAKPKRKTKKEQLAEAEMLRAKSEAADVPALQTPEVEQEPDDEPFVPEIEWGLSTDRPRKTVEDDPDLVLDIDGWQHTVKDDEDFHILQEVLNERRALAIGDADLWAYKQKQIKSLNNGGVQGPVSHAPKIDGYYVPNETGSARTGGLRKILQSEKSKYLPHRLRVQREREEREKRAIDDPVAASELAKAKIQATASSRANRLNNRKLANDITAQKLTLGADADSLHFSQLLRRKKNVRFDRSAIHNWGLYAGEDIRSNDFIIEYVGERVRQRVANLREERYDRQGVGSSYLFRIGEDSVIDATKKGGIARFINHSCVPNCTAKIIRSEGAQRICIYSCKDIGKDEELTYDYKFERELNSDDRIPCLCGSIGCKGFLN